MSARTMKVMKSFILEPYASNSHRHMSNPIIDRDVLIA
jgi:hypothetical protein